MKPWAQLERILARLPRHSQYKAAVDSDTEFAKLALQQHGDDEPTTTNVPLARYSELAVRLDNVFDAVCAINETLQAVYAKKKSTKPRQNRAPRPQTAYQKLRVMQTKEKLDSITDRMTGGR